MRDAAFGDDRDRAQVGPGSGPCGGPSRLASGDLAAAGRVRSRAPRLALAIAALGLASFASVLAPPRAAVAWDARPRSLAAEADGHSVDPAEADAHRSAPGLAASLTKIRPHRRAIAPSHVLLTKTHPASTNDDEATDDTTDDDDAWEDQVAYDSSEDLAIAWFPDALRLSSVHGAAIPPARSIALLPPPSLPPRKLRC